MRSPLYNLSVFKFGYASAQVIPRPIAQRIADGFAWWSLRNCADIQRIMGENLSVVTGRTGDALKSLVRDNVRSFSRMLADYFLCAGDKAERATDLVTSWGGLEHLDAARERGKGTILVTGHLGHWELGGLLLALRGNPLHVVTLPEPTPELMRWREAARKRLGIKTIAVGPGHDFAFVEMLRVLRENGCICMLVDRPYSGTGMPVKQFGHATHFSTAAATLAHHTGAAILPAFVLREDPIAHSSRYRAFACPPIMQEQGSLRDILAPNVQHIADLFAEQIRANPEQWYNYAPVFSAA